MVDTQMLPVCCSCKKVRIEGSWKEDPELVAANESTATHGLCPECARRLYPHLADRILN